MKRFRLIKHDHYKQSFIIGEYKEKYPNIDRLITKPIHVGIIVEVNRMSGYATLHNPTVQNSSILKLLLRNGDRLYYTLDGKRKYLNEDEMKGLNNFIKNLKGLMQHTQDDVHLTGGDYEQNIWWHRVKVWGLEKST